MKPLGYVYHFGAVFHFGMPQPSISSQHDDFARALKYLRKVVKNPLSSRRVIIQAANKVARTKVAQASFRSETLEDRLVEILAKCKVELLTRELRLGLQRVDSHVLLNEAGLPISRALESRLGRIMARLGYEKVRRGGVSRYIAP